MKEYQVLIKVKFGSDFQLQSGGAMLEAMLTAFESHFTGAHKGNKASFKWTPFLPTEVHETVHPYK